MSSMLEQAIVDATALKEAAIQNAEQELLEKYSQDIKEAVDVLLEMPGEELGMDQDPLAGDIALDALEGDADPVLDSIPQASTEGEKLCPCAEEDEIITVNLDQILAQSAEEEPSAGEMTDREELAEDIEEEQSLRMEDCGEKHQEEPLEESEEIEEDIDINEEDLRTLAEELTFEYEAKPTGYSSGTPVADLAQEQLVQAVQAEVAEANKESEDLKENLVKTNKQNQKFRKIILQLKDKLDEVSVSNARLLYTNRVLENSSLNERQKTKLVETISKAQTVEKAQMIYEALQSAVAGTGTDKVQPKSLNEVVSRPSTMIFSNRREEKPKFDHVMNRMQRLAGIKHS